MKEEATNGVKWIAQFLLLAIFEQRPLADRHLSAALFAQTLPVLHKLAKHNSTSSIINNEIFIGSTRRHQM